MHENAAATRREGSARIATLPIPRKGRSTPANPPPILGRVALEVRNGRSVLVVAATVSRAQDIHRRLTEDYGLPSTILHGRFHAEDRFEKERELIRRRGRQRKPRTGVAVRDAGCGSQPERRCFRSNWRENTCRVRTATRLRRRRCWFPSQRGSSSGFAGKDGYGGRYILGSLTARTRRRDCVGIWRFGVTYEPAADRGPLLAGGLPHNAVTLLGCGQASSLNRSAIHMRSWVW